MIIDVHNHIGKDSDGGSQTIAQLQRSMKENGIDYSVVFPFSAEHSTLIEESLGLLRASKKYNNIIPFLRLHPGKIDKETLISILGKGFKGIKLHPYSERFHPEDHTLDWFYRTVQEMKLPILFHTKDAESLGKPVSILRIARRFPDLNIILGHFFGDSFTAMRKSIGLKNVYSEVSICGRTLRARQMVEKGFDRLLFGSDSPYDDQEVELLKITKSGISQENIKKILEDNPRKLLNI